MPDDFVGIALPEDCVPEAICALCASQSIFHLPTQSTIAYCTHSQHGAVLTQRSGWTQFPDTPLDDFRRIVAHAAAIAELRRDTARHLQTIQDEPGTRH